MRALKNRRVLLGVTGGIAAYKAAALARLLTQAGAMVDVVLTRSATNFVGETTFHALTGRAVHHSLFEGESALDHIHLARNADAIVVAPATADFMARMATGRADDLLTATILAAHSAVIIAPAMNDHMWAHPATQRNIEQLRRDGVLIIPPDVGPLAAGEGEGPGRMAEPAAILEHVARIMSPDSPLTGKVVLVTAGPTREAIDPVRFISNHSSGKMGVAIASAAFRRGADVTLIAGAISVEAPVGVNVVSVESTEDMATAVAAHLSSAAVFIMAAAPADFRPSQPGGKKLPKTELATSLELAPTTDILRSTMASRPHNSVVVGFALETDNIMSKAHGKLLGKQLDLIVVNDALEEGAGFGVDTNRVTLLESDGREHVYPLLLKSEVAEIILDHTEALVRAKG